VNTPNSLEAEKALLSSLIIDPPSLSRIFNSLKASDFYHEAHGIIYSTILNLTAKNVKYDLIILVNQLEEDGHLKVIGGASYISTLAGISLTSSNIEDHAKIIKEKALRRTASLTLKTLDEKIQNESLDIKQGIQDVFADFSDLLMDSSSQKNDIKEILHDVYAQWCEIKEHGLGIPIGITELEKVIKGYRPGHYWVIMAYTSFGKTSFAIMLLEKLLLNSPEECVVFFSAEMTKEEIVGKLIAQRLGKEVYQAQKEMTTPIVEKIFEDLSNKNLYVFDNCLTAQEISLKLNFLRMKGKIPKVVFVDYIQNLQGRGANEYERMTSITTDLQGICIHDKICLVALSQVPDDAAQGSPILIKGKGTGAIGATAGLVMQLIRDKVMEADQPHGVFPVEVLITKNRYGPIGRFDVYHDKSTGLYMDKMANLSVSSSSASAYLEKQNLF